jgi:hypothetical protein
MEYREIMAKMTAAQAKEIDKHGGLMIAPAGAIRFGRG